ncbi:hypothetical protein B296_00047385 [Ensete ventricosum]|uniref:Uncharacterized protein n=1 Tax=Ensete ventricosum TaxID=4639 RepID=A0A426YRP1_ENSVE|nr:hypothetical protein B296_00047385 [Ensete ventricosum]
MGEVVVDALDVGVHGGDHMQADADATTDVDEQLLHDYGRVVPHELVEQTVEPGIGAVVLERRHPGGHDEGNAALQRRILHVVPADIVSSSVDLVQLGQNSIFPFVYHLWSFFPPSSPISPPQAEECQPSGSSGNLSGPPISSLGVMARANIKSFQALKVMKSCHDFDSIVSLESLTTIRKRYSISNEYVLHASGPGNVLTILVPRGSASLLMLKLVIGECFRW